MKKYKKVSKAEDKLGLELLSESIRISNVKNKFTRFI
tara:strand:- start:312 stop:422 length:111 start_codon:yes stop_codon:yes gene_type:complete